MRSICFICGKETENTVICQVKPTKYKEYTGHKEIEEVSIDISKGELESSIAFLSSHDDLYIKPQIPVFHLCLDCYKDLIFDLAFGTNLLGAKKIVYEIKSLLENTTIELKQK